MGFHDTQNMFDIDIETYCSQKITLGCIQDILYENKAVISLFISKILTLAFSF